MSKLAAGTDQDTAAKAALFAKHPSFKMFPAGHDFFIAKMAVEGVWLIDAYGGAAIISPSDYFAVTAAPAADAAPVKDEPRAAQSDPVETASLWRDGPPHGPTDRAFCPVTGAAINITATTPSVEFLQGQALYFATEAAAASYRESPRSYWLAPTDMPLPGMDGMRGLPDLRGSTLACPRSGETLTVDMKTPRVEHKHGQAVYFCCFGCVNAFWKDPKSLLAPPTAS